MIDFGLNEDEFGGDYYEYGDCLIWNGGSLLEYAEAAIDMFIFAEKYEIPQLRQDGIDRLV